MSNASQVVKKPSMRHLYLYTYLLLEQANKQGRRVRLEWANVATASIGPDPTKKADLLIQLPLMASVGTEEDATLLRALLSHEILCHGHHTDFSVVRDDGIGGVLQNLLEDPRGELKSLKQFPGSAKVIREGIEILVDRKVFQGPDPDATPHPTEILVSWLITELRSELLGQTVLEQFSKDYRKLARETFGSKLTAQVKAQALKAAKADTTSDVQAITRQIVEMLQLAKDDPPPPPKSGEQDDPEQGQGAANGEGQPGQQGPNEQMSGDAGDEPGKNDQPQQGAPEGQPASTGGYPSSGDVDGEPSPDDLARALDQVLKSTEKDAGAFGKGLEEVLTENNEALKPGYGRSHTNEMPEVDAPRNNQSVDRRHTLRNGAKATAAALSLRMEELLEARSMVERRKSSEGRLRPGRVWRVPLGELNVFQKRTRQDELDTVVYFLGDESGSMAQVFAPGQLVKRDGSVVSWEQSTTPPLGQGDQFTPPVKRSDAVGNVIVAAAEVLEHAGVPFGLATYHTAIREWQAIDGDWSQTLTRYMPNSTSSTNTHLAVVWAIRRMVGRPESRKILIVSTDGDPGDVETLEAAMYEGLAMGVEVRFVLIGAAEKHHYVDMSAPFGVATNPNELAKAVFGSLEAALA